MDGQVDASVPLGVKTAPPDYLNTLNEAMKLKTGVLQNRLLGQQVDGKIAMGKAAQAAVDPETGKFDGDKFLKTLAADSRGSFQVPEAAAQAVARELQQKQLDTATLELTGKRWAKIGDVAGMLLGTQKGPDGKPVPLTREAVVQSLSDNLIGSGLFNDPQAVSQIAAAVQTLPTDEKGIRAWLAGKFLQSHLTTEGVALVNGSPTPISTGGATQIVQASPLTGDTKSIASLPTTLTPAQAVTPAYQRFNPQTQKMENVLTGDAVAALPGGTGGNTAPPGIPAGPALGQAEGASASAQDAVRQLSVLRTAAEQAPNNKAQLMNLRDALTQFQPGPKANWSYIVGAISQQLGVAPPKVTQGVAAQEEFNKLATQFINNQVGVLGGTGTDAKLESARHGSPNEFMSREGVQNVTALMLGMEDAVGAKNAAWQKWAAAGNGPETYPQFVAQFNRYYSPRVFQAEYMSDAQRKTMLGNMTKDQRAQFEKDYLFAKKAGWIP
jgi:hypothetical protein